MLFKAGVVGGSTSCRLQVSDRKVGRPSSHRPLLYWEHVNPRTGALLRIRGIMLCLQEPRRIVGVTYCLLKADE